AGRTAESAMRIRLERQNRQHVIDVAAHGARASGPPGPDRGRYVIKNWNFGSAATNAARDSVSEIRTVDDDKSMRTPFDNCVGGVTDAAQDCWQPPRYSGEPDDAEFIDRKRAGGAG